MTQGAVEEMAYIIERGSCLVIVEKDEVLFPVDHYGEGDIVGGLGILTGEPRRAHIEAETEMDLWIMTRDQFDEFVEKDPALLEFITEIVADRFDSRRPTAYRAVGKYVTTDIIGRGAFSIVCASSPVCGAEPPPGPRCGTAPANQPPTELAASGR